MDANNGRRGAVKDLFKRCGPLWSEAEKLDAELATARIEFNDATEKSQQAETTSVDQRGRRRWPRLIRLLARPQSRPGRQLPNLRFNRVAFSLPIASMTRWFCWRKAGQSQQSLCARRYLVRVAEATVRSEGEIAELSEKPSAGS